MWTMNSWLRLTCLLLKKLNLESKNKKNNNSRLLKMRLHLLMTQTPQANNRVRLLLNSSIANFRSRFFRIASPTSPVTIRQLRTSLKYIDTCSR